MVRPIGLDATEFGLLARQSLGLSVITIEGSTTKKSIALMRLLKPIAPRIFYGGVRNYNGERNVGEKPLKTT